MAHPFCKLRPELRAELIGLRAVMAALRQAITTPRPTPQTDKEAF